MTTSAMPPSTSLSAVQMQPAGLAEIHDCFQRIAIHPDTGREIVDLPSPLRRVRISARFRRWLVFYRRIDDDTLEVVRVLHAARDVTALLRNPE